jgi:CRP-like cAMP-binding protein
MPVIPDSAVLQKKVSALPVVTYQAGENVLTAGSRTGHLLILKKGAVAIVKENIEIAKVAEPGAVFGELSTLLDRPHSADVRASETSQFHVADAAALLVQDPLVLTSGESALRARAFSLRKSGLMIQFQSRHPGRSRKSQACVLDFVSIFSSENASRL